MKDQKLAAIGIAVLTAMTLACSQATEPPTAPSGTNGAAGEANADGSTLKATAPAVVSPTGGAEIDDATPVLTINNSTAKFVPNLPLSYVFEVLNSANQLVYRSAPVPAGEGGRTSHEVTVSLNSNESHTWRAYAVYESHRGPMGGPASFKTLNRFGVSCAHLKDAVAIVGCRMEQHGGVDEEEIVELLREIAYDMNQAFGGEFGLLVKTSGNNCEGYSCDIICEGNGNDQNQYDILINDEIPAWNEVSNPTVRPCEVIR
jgi:hypothetical protein